MLLSLTLPGHTCCNPLCLTSIFSHFPSSVISVHSMLTLPTRATIKEDLTQIPLVNVAYCMSPLVKHNVCLYTKGSGEFCSQHECKLSSAFCDHTYYYSVEETLEYPGSINVLWGTIQHLQCLGNSLTYLGEARWEAESLPTREVTIGGLCVPGYSEQEAGHL